MATDLAVGSFFYLIGSFSSPHDLPLWTIRHVCRIAAARQIPGQRASASLREIVDDYNDDDGDNGGDADEYDDYDQDGLFTRPQGDGDMRP